jgi:hypothetical protein
MECDRTDSSPTVTEESFLTNCSIEHDFIEHLSRLRMKHKRKCVIAYLNINSYRYKHFQLNDVFKDALIDVFAIAETKLDDTHFKNLKNIIIKCTEEIVL